MNAIPLSVFAVFCLPLAGFSQAVHPADKAVVVESLFKGGATEGWRGANDAGLNQLLARRRRELERQLASCEHIIEEQLEKYGFTRPGGTVAMA